MGSSSDNKKALEKVFFTTHSWSDHYDGGVCYGLDVNGVHVSLDEKNAEKIMLAAGIGQVVWTIDWSLVGTHSHSRAIVPRIKGMKSVRGETTYDSKFLAEKAVKKEIQSRVDALKGHL